MFFNIFTSDAAADAGTINGAGFEVMLTQQATNRRAQGIVILLGERGSLALRRSRIFSSDLALVSFPALLPSRRRPRIWRDVTVVPSSSRTASRIPSADAGTSSTTLSVSISTSTSSRLTLSPGFLCQSLRLRQPQIQAGREQEYLRYSLFILYLIDVQRVIYQILLLLLVNGHISYCR